MTSHALSQENREHIPVLAQEVLQAIAPQENEIYVDATFGRGGYTQLILDAASCRVIGIDRDPDAITVGKEFETRYPNRFTILKGTFGELRELLQEIGIEHVNGVAFDIGVSSPQLDQADRGFSFRLDGPLDMRMGDEGETAADLVNELPEKELADVIYKYGEEHESRKIARAIVTRRATEKFTRTGDLAAVIASVIRRRDDIHPATKTFQALRIAVNDELNELEKGLAAAEKILAPEGRLAVVTFHSLEDRIVKDFMRKRSGREGGGSRHRPAATIHVAPSLRLEKSKPITAGEEELRYNPRSRSAKLRVAIKNKEVGYAA